MADVDIAKIESVLTNFIQVGTRHKFIYGERRATPNTPYVVIGFLSANPIGNQYEYYEPEDRDFKRTRVKTFEITFTFKFIGGNARGDLSLFLLSFSESQNSFILNIDTVVAMSFLRHGSIIDLSEGQSGDWMQIAQADLVFLCNIEAGDVVFGIETIKAKIKAEDQGNKEVFNQEITINVGEE
jgi:hypothetical protein